MRETGNHLQKNNRIWELDLFRGITIIFMLAWHLYFIVDAFCIHGFYTKLDSYAYVNATDPLHFFFDWGADGAIYRNFDLWGFKDLSINIFVPILFVISGISCLLSRNNLKKSVIILVAAYLVTGFSFVLRDVFKLGDSYVRFGILHCYGFCRLLYVLLFENRNNKTLVIVALISLAFGYYLQNFPVYLNTGLLFPFGFFQVGVQTRETWPLFPYLGWFLFGVILGRTVYREKKSLFRGRWQGQGTQWLQAVGKHSGKIYFFHIFGYTMAFMLIGWIFDLF